MKLLVIDIQKGITNEKLYQFDAFISNTTKLIQTAREHGIEVVYVQHDDGPGSGFSIGDEDFEIASQVAPKEGEKCFVKQVNSCFGSKEFKQYLKESKEDTLMMIGLQTNFCIDATIQSAFEKGYNVIVPVGANSTFHNDYMDRETTCKYYNEMLWPGRYANCVSMEEALSMLQAGA